MKKIVLLISNVEEYGKLMSFCINNDINVWRTYWNEREKGDRCYNIDWKEKRCYYGSKRYYINEGYEIVKPKFFIDDFGDYKFEYIK